MPVNESGKRYEFDGFRLIPSQRKLVSPQGEPVTVGTRVFELLSYLVENRGRLVGKPELMQALWPDQVVEENNLNQAVSALRQALGETAQSPRLISTVTGRGYQFVGQVEEISDVADSPWPRFRSVARAALIAMLALLAFWWLTIPADDGSDGVPVLVHFDELTPRLVTDYAGSHSEPTLSPDGTMLAWISDQSGTPQVWVKNLQLGEPIRITDGPFAASSPSWTPDNSYILFRRNEPGRRGIYRVGSLGTPTPQIIVDAGRDPSHASEVDAFAYSVGSEVWIANGDGSNRRIVDAIPDLAGFARLEPALSPDGKAVAFIMADGGPIGNVWVAPTDGGSATKLTEFTLENGFFAESPWWAPDGKQIVYSVSSRTGGSRLWYVDTQSLASETLTAGAGGARQPVISADGTRLAYTDTRSSWRITRVDPSSGERSLVYESRHPTALPYASPDRRQLVFFSMLPSGTQVFTIGIDGSDLVQHTYDDDGTNTLPFWSDDGRSILYYRGRSLHRLYVAEGRNESLLADFHWSSRNWPAIHGDKLYFHEFDPPRENLRGVIMDLRSGTESDLPVPLVSGEWSADGSELLGAVPGDALYICDASSLDCRTINVAGEPIAGLRPKWSLDEQRIFYVRFSETGECCTLWVINRDGSDNTKLFELTGYEMANSYYGIDANGMVFYNHHDRSASEIWLVAIE